MKTVAYLRVSTLRQDIDQQRLAILDYAHRTQQSIDQFVEIKVSSRKSLKERGIEGLFDGLQAGDLLLVSELSRLGRSLGQIIQIVDSLITNKIRFVSIKENIQLNGRQDMQSKVMVTMFGLFAEIERDLIAERTREGMAAAKAKGHMPGRPKGSRSHSKLDGKEIEIRSLLGKRVPKASIAKIMGVSRTTLHHFVESRKLHRVNLM
jgi:DNA invertase Pin-like site-specific DNA recombinase